MLIQRQLLCSLDELKWIANQHLYVRADEAARLVLAPRATVLPQPDDEPATDEPPPTAPPPDDSGEPGRDDSRDRKG